MFITLDQLSKIFPTTKKTELQKYVDPLNKTFERFHINTKARIACFLGQVGIESAYFTDITENLNYSVEGLLKVFPKYFTEAQAKTYARKPEKIANRVYSNRYGNGDEKSGDGWRYSGKGLVQITFKSTYQDLAKFLEMTVDDTVEYLKTPEGATISAGWYWAIRNLNPSADAMSIKTITSKINGGLRHLNERISLTNKAYKLL